MLPMWQMMVGVCVGLVAFILLRPSAVQYNDNEDCRGTGSRRRNRSQTDREGDTGHTPRYNSMPGDKCVICLVEMQNDNMTYMRCGHALHDRCYNNCKRHTKLCPICRERM